MKFLDAAMEFKFFLWVMGLFTAGVFLIWGFKMVLLIGAGIKAYMLTVPGVEQLIKLMDMIGQ